MNKVWKIIILILCALLVGVGAYFGTYYLDMLRKGGNVDIKVTFDDTKTYVIPVNTKLSREDALKEWPYIFKIENNGNAKGLYQIIIEDIENSTIYRKDLDYVLILDDTEIVSGNLDKLDNNILYTSSIDGNKIQNYKLYIWSNSEETKSEDIYEYQIKLNAIKDGGPGF